MLEINQLTGFGAGGSSGIEFVGSNTVGFGSLSLTSLTGGIDTAARTGDMVILVCPDGSSNFAITDWTTYGSFANATQTTPSADTDYLNVLWRIMPDPTLTSVTGGDKDGTIAMVFRGVNQTTPNDATRTISTSNNSASITTVTPNAVVVTIYSGEDNDDPLTAAPTGYLGFRTVNGQAWTGAAYKVVATPGAEAPIWAYSGSPDGSMNIALRPA